MNKIRLKTNYLCLALLALILLVGCSSKAPRVNYYSIVDTSLHEHGSAQAHPELAVSVGPVTLPGILQQRQIATGGKNGMYSRSDFHRWAGSLDRDFATAIGEQLAVNLGTERIAIYPDVQHTAPDWQVALDVLAMEGALGEESLLTVRWTLVNLKEPKQSRVYKNQLRQVPNQKSYRAWVEGQRQNIKELGKIISSAIGESSDQ